MTVVYPESFWLFIPLVLLIIPAYFNYRKGHRLLGKLAGQWRFDRISQIYLVRTLIYWSTVLLFFIFSILALAGISWTKEAVRDESDGLDIIFAVDISRSMLASDVSPDRLGRAGELISSITAGYPSGRFGLVVFKGEGEVIVPLTEDRIIMETAVNSLSPAMFTAPGTNLAKGINRALTAFPEGSPGKKMIILISDGEALSGNARTAARECSIQGIEFIVIGAGTAEGAMIYNADGSVVSDSEGQAVVTKLDLAELTGIAESASGRYYDLSDVKTPGLVLDDISSVLGGSGIEGMRLQNRTSYRGFLIAAMVFLVINLAASRIRWSRWY